jgi:hypothetical protein
MRCGSLQDRGRRRQAPDRLRRQWPPLRTGAARAAHVYAIFWRGLGAWGIRRFEGTRYDYVASLDTRRSARSRMGRHRLAVAQ